MKKFLKNYFTPDEQKILIFLLIFGFLGISLKFWGLKLQDKNLPNIADSIKTNDNYKVKIDLRYANAKLLATVPGIGKKKAAQIVEYRKKYGFSSKKDLMNIKGIGKKTYEKLEEYFIDFGDEKLINNKNQGKKTEKKKHDKKNNSIKKININTATYEELLSIKGIGPKKAKDILELRKKSGGKFTNIEQLTQIKGIGEKTVKKLKKFITLEQ